MKRLVMTLSLVAAALSLAIGSTDAEARLWRRCCNGGNYGYRGGYTTNYVQNTGTNYVQNTGTYAAQGSGCAVAAPATTNPTNPGQPVMTSPPPPPTEAAPSSTAPAPQT